MHIVTILKQRLSKDRMASEQGFTLIELLIVIVILGILAAIAVPTYLSFVSSAHTAAAESNVRSAIPAAEGVYSQNNPNSYYYNGGTSLTGADLRLVAPGVGPHVFAVALNGGAGYCIEDTEGSPSVTYVYMGGQPFTPMTAAEDANTGVLLENPGGTADSQTAPTTTAGCGDIDGGTAAG